MRKQGLSLALALGVVACASVGEVPPQSPSQVVYQAEGNFNAALSVANQYKSLPTCGATNSPVVCSNANVVRVVQQTANTAWQALQSAQATVTDPRFSGTTTDQVIVAAQNAVQAFVSVANSLKVK